jgi:malonyl-CoA/methylmalonyl-CoA synthetase
LALLLTYISLSSVIRYYGYRISVLELESHLAEVPPIVEAHILSVPDLYTCARVALLVRFSHKNIFDLGYVRAYLSDKLADYKLPTLMRILTEEESVLRTQTGKLIRNKTSQKFFPVSENYSLPPGIEVCYDIPKDRDLNTTRIDKA